MNALPPAKLKIPAKEAFRMEDKNFAVSSEWLEEHLKNKNTHNRADFDIHIEMEANDFYLNAELGTNFLTGMMDMTLFAKDETTKAKTKIGVSNWVNEDGKSEVNHMSTEDTSDEPFL